ncbi:MAG: hypothetical protein IKX70_08305 [Treponema sp.]|nr:hypothetical protein [Methanobrevibacter sp.]MBR5033645.1 hypothetical protein [Treponema sp.]
MKKIVGIIAALALAGSVFARPDIVPVITEFKGDASLEWIANLDNETTGMKNSTSSSFKIQMRSDDWGGDSTTGDGLWGEVTVRSGGGYTAEKGQSTAWTLGIDVSEAKIHFIDGDTYFNMQILKPDFSVGEIGYVLAYKSFNEWEDYKWLAVQPQGLVDEAGIVTPASETGTYALNPTTGEIEFTPTTPAVEGVVKTLKKGNDLNYQGFTLNFGIPILDLSFAFGDNGEQKSSNKEFAFKVAATVKPIDGLSLYAGFSKFTALDDYALAFTAAYNYKINDQFYVKPALQFTMIGSDNSALNAAVLFGWGDEGKQWRSDFLNFDNATKLNVASASYRTADGVSILLTKPIKEAGESSKYVALDIDAFDSKLLGDFGVTWGMGYSAWQDEVAGNKVGGLDKGALKFAAIYNTNVDIIYITARTTFGLDLAQKDDKFGIKYGLRVGTKELIANTDVYADYVGSYCKFAPCSAAAKDGLTKGIFKVGTKISF